MTYLNTGQVAFASNDSTKVKEYQLSPLIIIIIIICLPGPVSALPPYPFFRLCFIGSSQRERDKHENDTRCVAAASTSCCTRDLWPLKINCWWRQRKSPKSSAASMVTTASIHTPSLRQCPEHAVTPLLLLLDTKHRTKHRTKQVFSLKTRNRSEPEHRHEFSDWDTISGGLGMAGCRATTTRTICSGYKSQNDSANFSMGAGHTNSRKYSWITLWHWNEPFQVVVHVGLPLG